MRKRTSQAAKVEVKPEPRKPLSFELLRERLEWDIRSAEYTMKKFSDSFAKDPAYAFAWSADAFIASAIIALCKEVVGWIEKNAEMFRTDMTQYASAREFCTNVSKSLRDRAVRELRYPSHSTSVQSNEMAREGASAAYKLHERLEELLARTEDAQ